MRNEVVDFLVKKIDTAKKDFVFLTGDLGYSVLEPLRERLGNRFINVGIAEALMTTMASAFSGYGYKTFTYSITPFATLRCLEQIRNDACYHNMDVTVIGIGAGFGYGALGPTHHAIEDLAAIWSIPNIRVYNPGDLNEAYACFEHSWNQAGPKYLRLSKGGDKFAGYQDLEALEKSQVVEYFDGSDLTIISTGNILTEVLAAQAKNQNKSIQVLSCPVLKPFPAEELVRKIKADKVLVVEELSPYGGFSGEVSKAILKLKPGLCNNFKVISAADRFSKVVGSSDFQRINAGVSAASIAEHIKAMLG